MTPFSSARRALFASLLTWCALPAQTLTATASPPDPVKITATVSGPVGAVAAIFFSPGANLAGIATPFGLFHLDPANLFLLGFATVDASGTGSITVPVPAATAANGLDVALQAALVAGGSVTLTNLAAVSAQADPAAGDNRCWTISGYRHDTGQWMVWSNCTAGSTTEVRLGQGNQERPLQRQTHPGQGKTQVRMQGVNRLQPGEQLRVYRNGQRVGTLPC